MARFGRPDIGRGRDVTAPAVAYTVGFFGGLPAIVTVDDVVHVTGAPELFDTSGGALALADGYMTVLAGRFDSDEAMRSAAVTVIEQFELDVDPNADEFPVILVIGMTVVGG